MAAEEGFHEGDVNPAKQIGISGTVVFAFARGGFVGPLDPFVHLVDAIGFGRDGSGRGKSGDGEPSNRAREPAEGIGFVAGVVGNAREASGMESLHEESANSANESGKIGVCHPGSFVGQVEAGGVAGFDILEPRRDAIRVSGKKNSEAL